MSGRRRRKYRRPWRLRPGGDDIGGAVLQVTDILNLQEALEEPGRNVKAGMNRNVVGHNWNFHGPGRSLIVVIDAVLSGPFEIRRRTRTQSAPNPSACLAYSMHSSVRVAEE